MEGGVKRRRIVLSGEESVEGKLDAGAGAEGSAEEKGREKKQEKENSAVVTEVINLVDSEDDEYEIETVGAATPLHQQPVKAARMAKGSRGRTFLDLKKSRKVSRPPQLLNGFDQGVWTFDSREDPNPRSLQAKPKSQVKLAARPNPKLTAFHHLATPAHKSNFYNSQITTPSEVEVESFSDDEYNIRSSTSLPKTTANRSISAASKPRISNPRRKKHTRKRAPRKQNDKASSWDNIGVEVGVHRGSTGGNREYWKEYDQMDDVGGADISW